MRAEQLRRALHTATAGLLLWPVLTSWSSFRLALVIGTPLVLGLEWMRLRQPAVAGLLESAVPVFRSAERRRISGAAWLWIGYALAAWFPAEAAGGGILVAALADPAAALVGSRWGGGARKSWSGTATACLVAAAALLVTGVPWTMVAPGGLLAGALERWSGPLDDNLVMAPGVAGLVWLVS